MQITEDVVHHLHKKPKPLVVILGPTASGKTGFSIDLAINLQKKRIMAEVVNADSRQLYKYLDMGTAKITDGEKQGVPHHLLDVLDPKEETTAGTYQTMAEAAIDAILARGNLPLLVGGSMLYLSSIIDGLTMAPAANEALRHELLDRYEQEGGEALYLELQSLNPAAAAVVHPHNKPRLVRALEIARSTKSVPRTELRTGGKNNKEQQHSQYDCFIFGIHRDRALLYERINQRTKHMFDIGWIDEVRALMDRGYGPSNPGMKSHGYREIMQYLDKGTPSVDELIQSIATNGRHYARRQMAWWKGDTRIQWIDLTQP